MGTPFTCLWCREISTKTEMYSDADGAFRECEHCGALIEFIRGGQGPGVTHVPFDVKRQGKPRRK